MVIEGDICFLLIICFEVFVLGVIIFVVVIGNILILVFLYCFSCFYIKMNVFVLNLVIVDLFFVVFVMFFMLVLFIKYEWIFGNFMC